MAAIPPLKKLIVEDFPTQSAWIPNLLGNLNQFFSLVVLALSNGLTFAQNMNAQVQSVLVDLSQPSPYPVTFRSTLKSRPVGVLAVSATNGLAGGAAITGAVGVDWTYTQSGSVQINKVWGLPSTGLWTITLIVIGG